MNPINEKAEKLIPIKNSTHRKLSEIKGKKRCTFDDLIQQAIEALELVDKMGADGILPLCGIRMED